MTARTPVSIVRVLSGDHLHPAVEAEAALRLRRVIGVIAVMFAVGTVTRRLLWGVGMPVSDELLLQLDVGTGIWSLISAGFWWYSRRAPPKRVVWAGAVYEVLLCLDLAVLESFFGDFMAPPVRPSFAIFPLLAFPIAVPLPMRRRIAITVLGVTAMIVGAFASRWYQGVEAPLPPEWPIYFLPTAGAGIVAAVTGSITFKLSVEASDARRVGSYQLVEQLGSGGMGEVWRGRHQLLVRDAAIKIVRPDKRDSGAEATVRFEREAQATSVLRCPHTVQLYDFGTAEDGSFYYAMELLEGMDLEALVTEAGPLPERRVIHILRQLCRSLAEAHSHGLVHRDIKPANVVLCTLGLEHDYVKVLDFGLVKSTEDGALETFEVDLSATNVIRGTPAYLAPELALGEEITPATDLYAVGCVGYWLLAGRPPFVGRTVIEVVSQHLSQDPPPLSELAEVSPSLERLVHRCLSKAPGDRPRSAAEVEAELSRLDLEPWTEQEAAKASRPTAEDVAEAPEHVLLGTAPETRQS